MGIYFMGHDLSVKGYLDYIIRIIYLKHSTKASYSDTVANLVLYINQMAPKRLKAFQIAINHLYILTHF